jgi:hypothetical protein
LDNGDAVYTMPTIFSFSRLLTRTFLGFGNSIARREELEYLAGRIKDTTPGLRQNWRNGSMEARGCPWVQSVINPHQPIVSHAAIINSEKPRMGKTLMTLSRRRYRFVIQMSKWV